MHSGELIQNLIHKLEEGAGARYVRIVLLILAVVAVAVLYDLRACRNFSTPEAMDLAQLARNISEGKGYTTQFVRPLSLYLVQKHHEAEFAGASAGAHADPAEIKTAHPDLANPPVYPTVLAALMKALPFRFNIEMEKPFWSENGRFVRYQPEFLIDVFNEILLLAAAMFAFFLARRLFDPHAAWLSAALVLGCEMLWRFSVAGLPTLLLLVIFLGLAWCIMQIEETAREPQPRNGGLFGLSLAAGVLTGIGGLTLYAFGWTIIPVVLFLIFFSGPRRFYWALAAIGAFAVILTPWIVRNLTVSGTPFGTAGFAAVEGTSLFPGFQLERSVHPDLAQGLWLSPYAHKLFGNMREIIQNELPRLGGSWASVFFLAGLLMGFRGPAARRMRYFLLMCLGVFTVVQALGRTQLSGESPDVNSENLLVVLAPLVFIYGTVFFLTFLDEMKLPAPQLHFAVIAIFVAVTCLPMIATLLSPKNSPLAYPPYYPPDIQKSAGWMKANELMMSDVPWAVAWYGRRQCVWLTRDAKGDFLAVNDSIKPVQALYLTPETMEARLFSDCLRGREDSWDNFALQAMVQNQIPKDFPLRYSPLNFASGLFLTDSERWKAAKSGQK